MSSSQSVFPSGGHVAPACTWRRSTRRIIACSGALILCFAATGQTLGAQATQDFLTANIDSTVSPRDDFFQYANGAWLKRHPIPDDAARWGIGNVISEVVALRLRRINEDAATKQTSRGSIEQLIGDFWFTGMDSATINRQGLTPLKPDLDRIDAIQSLTDFIDVVALFHTRDQAVGEDWSRVLFLGQAERDQKNSDKWVYSLVQSGTSMSPAYYSAADPQRLEVREAFREYLFKTFLRLRQDSARAKGSADAVYELEAQLARAHEPGYAYQKIALAELAGLAPTIDWTRYLRHSGATVVDSVNMPSPRFYQTLDSLLRTTPLESWKNYLRFWLINANARFLDDSTFADAFAYNRTKNGAVQPRPRWQRVLDDERNRWLGQPLARLYVAEYFPHNLKARYQAVAESMRDAFRQRIERVDWMSDRTKQHALRKLARLKITIGLSEQLIDFSTMPLRRDSYVLNAMRASTWYRDRDMKKLNQRVDRSGSDPRPRFSTAEYDFTNNEVRFGPAAVVIVPGLRDQDIEDAVIYAATALGHEIAHALGSEGQRYDADGKKADWWTARDDSAFHERAQVMVAQYNGFVPVEGLHVNGERSLPENMADLVGLRIALDAFKNTEQFRNNERICGFTPMQRFFLAYAYGRMGQDRKEALIALLRNGAYAPLRERVNGVLMNIPEFHEAFGVKPGDRMYLPEGAMVKIW